MAAFDEEYENAYDGADESGGELSGYTVFDENEEYLKKVLKETEAEEETIASPIPENEQKVIVDDAFFFGVQLNDMLTPDFNEGVIYKFCEKSERLAKFKPAFLAKLKTERAGQWVKVTYYCESPSMVKLEFSLAQSKEFSVRVE